MVSELLSPVEQQERLESAHSRFIQTFGALLTTSLKDKLQQAVLNQVEQQAAQLELTPIIDSDTATTLGFKITLTTKNKKTQSFTFNQETDPSEVAWWYISPIFSTLVNLLNQYDKANINLSPPEKRSVKYPFFEDNSLSI